MGRFAYLLDRPSVADYALRPNDKNDISPPSVVSVVTTKTTKVPFGRFGRSVVGRNSFSDALNALAGRCPDYVATERWRQCVRNGERFIAEWGDKAEALGWTADDLFALHTPPEKPHPSYSRLSRRECTGLLWLLRDGERIAAITQASVTTITASGATLTHRKRRP